MVKLKNIILLFVIIFLLCSCGINDSEIIGNKFNENSSHYGNRFGLNGYKYINGSHYKVHCVYYRNKVLVYVLDSDLHIKDYFITNFVPFKKAEVITLGSDFNDIVKQFGEPVFSRYPDIFYDSVHDHQGIFICQYVQKSFGEYEFLKYDISQDTVFLVFDNNGKLKEKVSEYFEWRP
jgi:hypothetical protein